MEVKVPELGESVETAEVLRVLVSEGDRVERDQVVLELETDKASVEVPCPEEGTVTKIHVSEGDEISVGDLMLTLGEASEAEADAGEKKAKRAPDAEAAKDTQKARGNGKDGADEDVASDVDGEDETGEDEDGEGDEEDRRSQARSDDDEDDDERRSSETRDRGDEQRRGEGQAKSEEAAEQDRDEQDRDEQDRDEQGDEDEQDQAEKAKSARDEEDERGSSEESETGGDKPRRGDKQAAGSASNDTAKEGAGGQSAKGRHEKSADRAAANGNGAQRPSPAQRRNARERSPAAYAGPATRRLARELDVDLKEVQPGGDGRITREDLKAYVRGGRELHSPSSTTTGSQSAAQELPDFEQWGEVERQALTRFERSAAERLTRAWREIPHVTHHDAADVTELEGARARMAEAGDRITLTAFLLKAAGVALQQFPRFNSSLDVRAGELVRKRYIHLAVAIDTEHGLVAPVIRDCEQKSARVLGEELVELAERAKERKLRREQLEGATFTISNVGPMGGTGFTPIIIPPQVAILGVARTQIEPRWHQEEFVPRHMLPLSLSYDHRVINGADAARFTTFLAELLAEPLRLVAEL